MANEKITALSIEDLDNVVGGDKHWLTWKNFKKAHTVVWIVIENIILQQIAKVQKYKNRKDNTEKNKEIVPAFSKPIT